MDFQHTFTLFYGAVLSWLSLTIIQQGKKLVLMNSKLDVVEKTMDIIDKNLDGVNTRIDLFLKAEIDTLKELIRKAS